MLRQQIGWVLFSVIALVVLQVASALWPGDDWLGVLSLGLLPIGITVAILRANLLDIRIVVSRSLLYLVLTGGIALVYLGLVAGLSWLSLGLNTGAAVWPRCSSRWRSTRCGSGCSDCSTGRSTGPAGIRSGRWPRSASDSRWWPRRTATA